MRCGKYVLSLLIMLLPWSRENMSGAEGPWGMLRAPVRVSFFGRCSEDRAFMTSQLLCAFHLTFCISLPAQSIAVKTSQITTTKAEPYQKRSIEFSAFFLLPSRPLAQILVLRVRLSRNLLPKLHTPQVEIHVSASQRREADCSTSRIRNGTYGVGRSGKQQQEQNSLNLGRTF